MYTPNNAPPFKAPTVDLTSPVLTSRREKHASSGTSLPCVAHKVYTYHTNCGCFVDDLMALTRSATCSRSHHYQQHNNTLNTTNQTSGGVTGRRQGSSHPALHSPRSAMGSPAQALFPTNASTSPAMCTVNCAPQRSASTIDEEGDRVVSLIPSCASLADVVSPTIAGDAITCLVVTRCNVWAGYSNGDIKVINARDGSIVSAQERVHCGSNRGGGITNIVCCGDLGVVTTGDDGRVLLWKNEVGALSGAPYCIHQFPSPVKKVAWCEGNNMLAASSDAEMVMYRLLPFGALDASLSNTDDHPIKSRLFLMESEGFSEIALAEDALIASKGARISVWAVSHGGRGLRRDGSMASPAAFELNHSNQIAGLTGQNNEASGWPVMPSRRADVLDVDGEKGAQEVDFLAKSPDELIAEIDAIIKGPTSISNTIAPTFERDANGYPKLSPSAVIAPPPQQEATHGSHSALAAPLCASVEDEGWEAATIQLLRDKIASLEAENQTLKSASANGSIHQNHGGEENFSSPSHSSHLPSQPSFTPRGAERYASGEHEGELTSSRTAYNLKLQVDTLLKEVSMLTDTLAAVRREASEKDAASKLAAEEQLFKMSLIQKENDFLRAELSEMNISTKERLVVMERESNAQWTAERTALEDALRQAKEQQKRLEFENFSLKETNRYCLKQLEDSDVSETNALKRALLQHEKANASSRQLCEKYRTRIASLEQQLGELAAEVDNRQWFKRNKEVQTTESYMSNIPVVSSGTSPAATHPSPRRGGVNTPYVPPVPRKSSDQLSPASRKSLSFSPQAMRVSKRHLFRHDPQDPKHMAECIWCSGRTLLSLGGTFGVNKEHSPLCVPDHPEGSYSHSPSRATSFAKGCAEEDSVVAAVTEPSGANEPMHTHCTVTHADPSFQGEEDAVRDAPLHAVGEHILRPDAEGSAANA